MPEYRFVDLKFDSKFVKSLASEKSIGIDTEFMREKTFFSQLCLIQIAAQDEIMCADPIGLSDADAQHQRDVWQSLATPGWVLHSGRQDVEVFYQACGLMPPAVFDTQIAAALLGYQPQLGYAGLVKDLFDVDLDKSHTRADWSKRPLSTSVLQYAAEDVLYLLPAQEILQQRLSELGRLDWALQDSADLLDKTLYEADPEAAIHRMKGARNLRGRARATAARLASWREKRALKSNRPRQWIMRDKVLLELATTAPQSELELSRIEGLSEGTMRRSGGELLGIVAATTHDADDYRPPQKPSEKQKAMLKTMQEIVAAAADSLSLASEIIAPKKELSAALLGTRDSRVFSGWRGDLVGGALLDVLDHQA